MIIKYDAVQGVGYALDGEFDESQHPRDQGGRWVASGDTFRAKDILKASGFKFHAETKTWRGSQEHFETFQRLSEKNSAARKATDRVSMQPEEKYQAKKIEEEGPDFILPSVFGGH